MLIVEDILNKMKVHFPKWMNIRRKVKSSTGGACLQSIALEIGEIEKAIDEYTKDFFITNYIDSPEDISAFLYKGNIGNIEVEDLVIITEGFEITSTQDILLSEDGYVLYEDGFIYSKVELPNGLEVAVEKHRMTIDMEKVHTWNIYDEFAVFLGIERYQWESNSYLLNRILSHCKYKINSSESGLQNAIINSLVNLEPTLKKEDIIIERPTAKNLEEKYKNFNSILDYLGEINRDVYMNKKWDVDTWSFAIKSVEYIPHAWDVALKAYANGVGFEDDLKVSIVDKDSTTAVSVNLYRKQKESINAYVKNNNIKEKTTLELIRYNHDLKPKRVKYKITATEGYNINSENILIDAYENKIGTHTINLEDIADPFMFGVDIKDNSILESGYDYRIDFIPLNNREDFIIEKCMQRADDGTVTNLINQNRHGFETFGEHGVKNSSIKTIIKDQHQFLSMANIHKELHGFVISDTSKDGVLEADISGFANLNYDIDYDIKKVPVMLHDMKLTNCYIGNETVIADTVEDEKTIEVNMRANEFSTKIFGGYKISYSIDNSEDIKIENVESKEFIFEIPRSKNQKEIKIKISLINGNEQAYISDIEYSKFDIDISTDTTSNMTENGTLPNVDTNTIYVKLRSFIGSSVTVKDIVIGNLNEEVKPYDDISVVLSKGAKLIAVYSGCRLKLTKLLNGSAVNIVEDYKPMLHYTSQGGIAQIVLLMESFTDIEEFIVDGDGSIETFNYGDGFIQYTLNIGDRTPISQIKVLGTVNKKIESRTLSSVLSVKGFSFLEYEFYVAKGNDKIIAISQSGIDKYIEINKKDIFNKINMSTIVVDVNGQKITPSFRNGSKGENISTTNVGEFKTLSFTPSVGNVYVALNETETIFPHTKDIDIINTFNNGFNPDSRDKLYYKVESLNTDYDVKFACGRDFPLMESHTFDNTKMEIKIKDAEKLDFNYQKISVDFEYNLGSSVSIPDKIKLANKETIDFSNYIITNDLNIEYKDRLTDSENTLDYEIVETLINTDSSFFKLKHSNIDRVDVMTESDDSQTIRLEEGKDFKILYKEGICIILKDYIIRSQSFNISYSIKKASAIIISLDELYDKVSFAINSFKRVDTINLEKIANNQTVDLNIYQSYNDIDLVTVKCEEAGFTASEKEGIVKFVKNLAENTVAVKSGFYYLDGEEYYMFSNRNDDSIDKIDNVYLYNTIKADKKLIMNQDTSNYIENSNMKLGAFGEVYFNDCKKSNIEGISQMMSISACDNFNYWKSFGLNMEIVKGFNDSSIKFTTTDEINGYAYINITDFLVEDVQSKLSFYMKGNAKAYLAKNKNMISTTNAYNQSLTLEIFKEIEQSQIKENIYNTDIIKENEVYYLVITGTGEIDDMLIVEKSKYNIDSHIKNVSHLNLDIEENVYTEYTTRLFLTSEYGSEFDGTEIKKDGSILNTSYVNWGFTNIEKLEKYSDFKKFNLHNVDVDAFNNQALIKTKNKNGKISTQPISIGNTKTIKNIVIKINDVMFETMEGFKIVVSTSDSKYSNYKDIAYDSNNMFSIAGDKLESYIKISIDMPYNKVISIIEIFAEYLSDDENSPSQKPTLTGGYLSKVLDAKFNERFIIKNMKISDMNSDISKYKFEIRASKGNTLESVWSEWKEMLIVKEIGTQMYKLENRIVFDGFRYYQFKLTLNGEGARIKADSIDLEVI